MAVVVKKKVVAMKLYRFGKITDGSASMKNTLGGKGANLAEMSKLGLPVPSGFTIPCEVSMTYQKGKNSPAYIASFASKLGETLNEGLDYIRDQFTNELPLLSVRSGARVSMPGMMDTILNVGITSTSIEYWRGALGDRAALDCYRRLIQMLSSVALGVPMEKFESVLAEIKLDAGVSSDADLNVAQLERLVSRYLAVVDSHGVVFPDTLKDQLTTATLAVFQSWENPRAVEYRKIHGYPDDWGTAVTVQAMAFGNRNDASATGVLFSRCPSTGLPGMLGEFLVNAQGEDVVAGIRTPEPLSKMNDWNPKVYSELSSLVAMLEKHYGDMQDIEFTIDSGVLFILQTRSGKRSAKAAVKIAHDLVVEGVLDINDVPSRVSSKTLFAMMTDSIDPAMKTAPDAQGIAAGGGVVSGVAVFSSEDAVASTVPCILVRSETDPDDIAGMNASVGILTATGGLTSHAAVVARGMNKSCVVGVTAMTFSPSSSIAVIGGKSFKAGDKVTIDGATGRVWVGVDVPVIKGSVSVEAFNLIEKIAAASGRQMRLSYDGSAASVLHSKCFPIYIDTALLDSLGAQDITKATKALGAELMSSGSSKIFVDLTSVSEFYQVEANAYSFMFGSIKDNDMIIGSKALGLLAWDSALTSRCVVVMGSAHKEIAKRLVEVGFSVSGVANTVADLLAATGPMSVPSSVVSSVFGTQEAYDLVMQLIEKHTGKSFSEGNPNPMYWYEALGG